MQKEISGIFAPICTPFKDDDVAYDQLKSNMERYRETQLSGYFVLGSNGECAFLTEKEKLQIVELVIGEKTEEQLVMVGAGHESTRQTISFGQKAVELGADFISILTPSYYKKRLTDEAMIRYYSEVAEALNVPIIVYNAPGFTGTTLSPEVVRAISAHPNIAGMKDTSKGNMSAYINVSDKNFTLLSGSISTLFESIMIGANGGVVSLANILVDPCIALYKTAKEMNLENARKLHYTLITLSSAVSGRYGVAGVKYAMELCGYFGGIPRRPLLPLTESDRGIIECALEKSGFLSGII